MKHLTITHKLFSRIRSIAVLGAALSVFSAQQASAQISPCLVDKLEISTGIDPMSGTVITPGVGNQDPHWYVSYLSPDMVPIAAPNTPNYAAYVITPDPGWITSGGSGWIGTIPANGFPTSSTRYYAATFSRNFTLCEDDEIRFKFKIANDNYCPSIRVDGVPVPPGTPFSPAGCGNPANFNSYTGVSFTLALGAGVHTIEVDVVNFPHNMNYNPHGLDIIGAIGSATGSFSIVSDKCPKYRCDKCNPEFIYCIDSRKPYDVTLTAVDPGQAGSYDWFVDGVHVGSGPSINYSFPGAGSYEVCLYIRRDDGTECKRCLKICIDDNKIPHQSSDPKTKMAPGSGDPLNIEKVYPNPTHSMLNIELKTIKKNNLTIRLFDISGKAVIDETRAVNEGAQKISINMEQLGKGLYLLEVSDGVKTIKEKVVKE